MNTAQYLVSGTKLTEEQRSKAEQLFLESQQDIEATVYSLIRKYGGEFDDMMSEAASIFLAAYSVYDDSIPFSAWLRNWVRWELIDSLRSRLTKAARYAYEEPEQFKSHYRTWTTADFAENLSEDAATAIRMIFDGPEDFTAIVNNKGGQPRNYRSTLREYLDAAGWSQQRIVRAFQEIKFALMEA